MAERSPLTICGIGASGSSHVVTRLRIFAERGHRVYLICESRRDLAGISEIVPQEEVLRRSRILRGLHTMSLKLSGRPLPGLTIIAMILLPRIIRDLRPDLIHIHYAYSFWAWMSATLLDIPIAVSLMGADILFEEQGSPTGRGQHLTIELLRRADLITAKSNHLIEAMERYGRFGAKLLRVTWGIDRKIFHRREPTELRKLLGLTPGQPVILSPRMLQPFYNIDLIVEAMVGIVAQVPDAVLLIAEHQPVDLDRRRIIEQIAGLEITGNVRLIGDIPHEKMVDYYSLATIAVAVPPSDGLPQSLLEAMACGVVNLLSALPRYEEFVTDGESALFVKTTPGEIAAGAVRLLIDAELRERIARNGLEIVYRIADFDREVERVERGYYEMINATPNQMGWLWRIRMRIGTILDFIGF